MRGWNGGSDAGVATAADWDPRALEQLPDEVRSALGRYEALEGPRDAIGLGRFLRRGLEMVTLSCVDAGWREHALITKHLFIIWNAYLDDVVDTRRDVAFAEQMLAVPFRGAGRAEGLGPVSDPAWMSAYVDLWRVLGDRFAALPRHEELRELLAFDIRQFLNCLRYDLLLERFPGLVSSVEHRLYQPHSMNLVIFSTIDLMASPGFDMAEIGLVREIASHAQLMARINNDLATWEREVDDGDFSSSVMAYACEENRGLFRLLTHPGTATRRLKRWVRRSGASAALTAEWSARKDRIVALEGGCGSVDIGLYVRGLERLRALHEAAKGRI